MESNPRLRKLAARVGRFFQQYSRKSDARHDPNDRSYDRRVERKLKKLSPEDFDELLNGDAGDDPSVQ
jgi:hypothetical protein